jgi:hypothetical protein
VAEPEVVRELPVPKAAGERGRPEALAGMISGNLAATLPPAELALAVELALAMEEARDLVVPD